MQGKKTHQQQVRILERKDDVPKPGDAVTPVPPEAGRAPHAPDARASEFAVSRGGMHQESQHNKHNDPGQSEHKPQKHTPAEEGK
jgi:hypothetical protein